MAAGVGGRAAGLIAAVVSATAFDFFDARPYGQLSMTAGRDVVTALFLVGVGVVVGELTVRLRRYRALAARRGEDFAIMSGAAQLMGFGEEATMVVAALGGELVARLGLADCQFEIGPLTGERPHVTREGVVVDGHGRPPTGRLAEVDLPVWAGGELVGRYRMTLRDGAAAGSGSTGRGRWHRRAGGGRPGRRPGPSSPGAAPPPPATSGALRTRSTPAPGARRWRRARSPAR